MGEWVVPFNGRKISGAYNQNFLWQQDNVYIMDNHRAALWCWMQQLSNEGKYNIFHIDRHYDTLGSRISEWIENLPDLWKISISDYLIYEYESREPLPPVTVPLFRFDNYLSIFVECFSDLIAECHFLTHQEGDKPDIDWFEHRFSIAPNEMEYWLSSADDKWIINIDLDFFFGDKNDSKKIQIITDEYIADVMKTINDTLTQGKIEVLTICLSPEHCGGWLNSEKILGIVCSELNIEFSLPDE